jgi:hypothetical protein
MADTDDILPEAPPAPPGDAVLDQLARSENIEAYARERADQDQETETEPVQDADRAARLREAMAEARRDSAEARERDGLDSQIEDAQAQRAIIGTALEQAWRNRHGSDRPAVFQLDGSRILQAEKDAVLWRCRMRGSKAPSGCLPAEKGQYINIQSRILIGPRPFGENHNAESA